MAIQIDRRIVIGGFAIGALVLGSVAANAEGEKPAAHTHAHPKQAEAPKKAPATAPAKEKVAYAIGYQTGDSLRQQNVEITVEDFIRGLKNGVEGAKSEMTRDEIRETFTQLRTFIGERRRLEMEKVAGKNKKTGDEFRAANAKKEGVKSTASGLQYQVLTEGKGPKPKATDTVRVHYTGTLIDGTEFDSTKGATNPTQFLLNRVIPGWTEGLQLMNQGSKYRFVIPPELAYGQRGSGAKIGPNSTLIFEVELVEIVKVEKPKTEKPKAEPKPAAK